MIHQCFFAESHRSRLFQSPVYRPFGLEPEVNPDLCRNCPELEVAAHRPQLCEYAALLHLWRNPDLDPDPWIGFSSYRQLEKFSTVFQSGREIEELLRQFEILAWGGYEFVDARSGRPVSLSEQGERCHPGLTSALWKVLMLRNEPMPENYLCGNSGLFCTFWIMSRTHFDEFMQWSAPMILWYLQRPDHYTAHDRRALSFLAERLFICWYGLYPKKIALLAPITKILSGNRAATSE